MNHLTQESPRETVERCQKHGAEWIGDKVEFTILGVDTPRAAAKAIFERHGFGKFLLETPRPDTVLKECSRRGRTPKGYFTRPFVSPNKDTPVAIHVTQVSGTDESGDEYSCLARIRIGYQTDPVTGKEELPFAIARPPEGQTDFSDGQARERAEWIAKCTNHCLTHVLNADVADGVRKALQSLGAVKSIGGGNNYWVRFDLAERVHAFLSDIHKDLGAYYLRTPITSLGPPQVKAAMGQAATVSLEDDLSEMEEALAKAIEYAKSPTMTKSGKLRKTTGTLKRRVEMLQGIGSKLKLYENVIESRVVRRMDALRDKLEKSFTVLLDGEGIVWEVDDAAKGATDATDSAHEGSQGASNSSEGTSDAFGWDETLEELPEAPEARRPTPVAPVSQPSQPSQTSQPEMAASSSADPFGWG